MIIFGLSGAFCGKDLNQVCVSCHEVAGVVPLRENEGSVTAWL